MNEPPYTHGSADRPVVNVDRSFLATALCVEHGHEGELAGTRR